MKQITTGTVQTAQIEVTNLHDDTREFYYNNIPDMVFSQFVRIRDYA